MGDFLKKLFGIFLPVAKETAKAIVTLQADTILRAEVAKLRTSIEGSTTGVLRTTLLLDVERVELALNTALAELGVLTATGGSGAGSDEG